MIRRCAACMGLLGFCGAIVCGLWAGNRAETVLIRALWVMVAFVLVGSAVAWVGLQVVQDHLRQQQEELSGGPEEQSSTETSAQEAAGQDGPSQPQAA